MFNYKVTYAPEKEGSWWNAEVKAEVYVIDHHLGSDENFVNFFMKDGRPVASFVNPYSVECTDDLRPTPTQETAQQLDQVIGATGPTSSGIVVI